MKKITFPVWSTSVTKTSKIIVLTLFVFIPILTFMTGYYFGTKSLNINNNYISNLNSLTQTNQDVLSTTSVTTTTISPIIFPTTMEPYSSWKTYTNSYWGYSFKYPSNWTIDLSEADLANAHGVTNDPHSSMVSVTDPISKVTLYFSYADWQASGPYIYSSKSENITIDNKTYVKSYSNSCYYPNDSEQQNIEDSVYYCNESTKSGQPASYFNSIDINLSLINKDNYNWATGLFKYKERNIEITVSLGDHFVKIDDPKFSILDNTLDQIFESIVMPYKNLDNTLIMPK